MTHSYHLYTYTNDIQPETRVLVSSRRYIHPPPSKEHHVPCFPSAYNVVLFAPKRQTARPRGGKCHQECRDIYTKGNYCRQMSRHDTTFRLIVFRQMSQGMSRHLRLAQPLRDRNVTCRRQQMHRANARRDMLQALGCTLCRDRDWLGTHERPMPRTARTHEKMVPSKCQLT